MEKKYKIILKYHIPLTVLLSLVVSNLGQHFLACIKQQLPGWNFVRVLNWSVLFRYSQIIPRQIFFHTTISGFIFQLLFQEGSVQNTVVQKLWKKYIKRVEKKYDAI